MFFGHPLQAGDGSGILEGSRLPPSLHADCLPHCMQAGDGSGILEGSRLAAALDSAAMPRDVAEALRPLVPSFEKEFLAMTDFKYV